MNGVSHTAFQRPPAEICRVREDTAKTINATLVRLPAIIEVLQETAGGDPIPGNRDLRLGALAGLTEIVQHLSWVPRQPGENHQSVPGPEEEHAMTWLLDLTPVRWLPSEPVVRLTQIIQHLLPDRLDPDSLTAAERSYPIF